MTTAKTTRDVTKRLSDTRVLLSSLRTQGPEVARLSLRQVRPFLREGDREPDYLADLVGLGRQLRGVADRLEGADDTLYSWNAELASLGEEQRDKSRTLRAWLVGLRRSVLGQFVEPDLIGLGLERQTARDTDGLLRQARRVSETFLGDDVGRWLGESLFPEATFRPEVHGEQLAALVAETEEVRRRIDEGRRRRDEAQLEKRAAMKEHDRIYLRTARMFEELCRHAGKEELAERVRPSARRRRAASSARGEGRVAPPPVAVPAARAPVAAGDRGVEPPSGGRVGGDAPASEARPP